MAEEGQVNKFRALMGRTASWSLEENTALLQTADCVDRVCVRATTQPVLTYVNIIERTRAGARIAGLLSYQCNSTQVSSFQGRGTH